MGLFDALSYSFEPHDVAVFFTLILLEGVLSFDNAAVLAAMVRKLPPPQRRRALFYGLAGAYAFRFTAILLAAYLIQNSILRIIGGLYLLYLTVHHFTARNPHEGHITTARTVFGLSAFWSTIVLVETADIVFALDQIVAAVALTQKLPLIIAASFLAIIALRISATYMIRLMDWFPPLEALAYLAVGWVGIKLLTEEAWVVIGFDARYGAFHVPRIISVGVTLSLLVVPVLVKLGRDIVLRRRAREAGSPTRAGSGPDTRLGVDAKHEQRLSDADDVPVP